MKKLLVLNGSPRGRGSTSLMMVKAFLEGYTKATEADVQEVDLAFNRILTCKGCYQCWRKGTGRCFQEDDMESLLPAYQDADLVLVNTPVYHFGMTAILKAFFERTLPMLYPYIVKKGEFYTHPLRRPMNPEQAVGLFATSGFPDDDNFRVLDAHAEKLFGSRLRFRFHCPEGELLKVSEMSTVAGPRLAALRQAGEVFAKTGLIPNGAEAAVAEPMVGMADFARLASVSWAVPGEEAPTEAALAGLEPYSPTGAPGLQFGTAASPGGGRVGEGYAFLKRMCALFNPEAADRLEAVIQYDFTDLGETCQVRISKGKCVLESGSPAKPSTRIIVPFSIWQAISKGELDGQEALIKGAYRVEGGFDLMMRLGSLFSPTKPATTRRPNLMALAFAPWYLAWFLGGSFALGEVLPLGVSLAFLAWRESRTEATWFERGTVISFAFIAALALAAPTTFAAWRGAIVNLAIGLVWALSLAYNRTLTSEYSKSSVSENVASGRIFRKLNAQLTALWAVLFALSAVADVIFASLGQGTLSILTAIVLVPMGIFTGWYPKWYPSHLAHRGGASA